jgi:F0F1-type ATP synthase membrane subunit b/b'
MEFILEIARSIIDTLHLNQTFFVQLLFFIVTFGFLSLLLFKPYYKAYEQRLQKTQGSEDIAVKMLADSESLYSQYQEAARQLNLEIKAAYDELRGSTQKETDNIINTGRKDSQGKIDKALKEMTAQLDSEENKALALIPEISSLIRTKLLGKEMNN